MTALVTKTKLYKKANLNTSKLSTANTLFHPKQPGISLMQPVFVHVPEFSVS